MTIREIIAKQRWCSHSQNPAEQFAAALLLSGVLAERLRGLSDFHLAQVLDREVCSNLSVLVPELTLCMAAAERLCRRRAIKLVPRRRSRSLLNEGDHILHAEAALYRAGIPFLQLPWQKNRFASGTLLVSNVAEARAFLLRAGFRDTPRCSTALVHSQTRQPIRNSQE